MRGIDVYEYACQCHMRQSMVSSRPSIPIDLKNQFNMPRELLLLLNRICAYFHLCMVECHMPLPSCPCPHTLHSPDHTVVSGSVDPHRMRHCTVPKDPIHPNQHPNCHHSCRQRIFEYKIHILSMWVVLRFLIKSHGKWDFGITTYKFRKLNGNLLG